MTRCRAFAGVTWAAISRAVVVVLLALLAALFAEPGVSLASCSGVSGGSTSSPAATSSPSPSSSPTDTATPAPSPTDTTTPAPVASAPSSDSCVSLSDDQYQPLYAAAGIAVFFLSAGYVRGMRSRG